MTKEQRRAIYAELIAPFPAEALEHTDGRATGRGYSTTGIRVQYVVDRLCEVLGVGGFRTERTLHVKETSTAKGRSMFEVVCELRLQLGEWSAGVFVPFAESLGEGGHTAISETDARKGAYGNALKRAAAACGVGRDAYRGTLAAQSAAPAPDAPRTSHADIGLTGQQRNALASSATRIGMTHDRIDALTLKRFGTKTDGITRTQAADLPRRVPEAAVTRCLTSPSTTNPPTKLPATADGKADP